MSTQSEQPVWGVPAGPLPIFVCPNHDPPVLLPPPPIHGGVANIWEAIKHLIESLVQQE